MARFQLGALHQAQKRRRLLQGRGPPAGQLFIYRRRIKAAAGQADLLCGQQPFLFIEARHGLPVYQPQLVPQLCQARIGVVFPEQQAVFRPGGE